MARKPGNITAASETGDTAVQADETVRTQDERNEMAAAGENPHDDAQAEKVRKSIVPAKYGTKYRRGGTDALATFINEQSKGEDGKFAFPRFFDLVAANGVDAAEVEKYRTQVAEKRHGAPGRARMTLRNRLATIARKEGSLTGNDGQTHAVEVAALPKREKVSEGEQAAA
jgi:hypothetical protein